MGLLELILIILIIAAVFGRGPLALGAIFDLLIAVLVIGLVIRLIYVLF
ncbi:MAG: hypothetical protein QG639_411 [Patescibacteria group bacterium]|jgi:hypothetical protein|nr:hypothetical protein [Patescibacteria group bacterium]